LFVVIDGQYEIKYLRHEPTILTSSLDCQCGCQKKANIVQYKWLDNFHDIFKINFGHH